jgi:hypothetical protein
MIIPSHFSNEQMDDLVGVIHLSRCFSDWLTIQKRNGREASSQREAD